jgi:hypothetical protein
MIDEVCNANMVYIEDYIELYFEHDYILLQI